MKTPFSQRSHSRLLAAASGILLVGSTSAVFGVGDRTINTFNTDISGCGNAWGGATAAFDAAQDATGNAGGALYISGDLATDQNCLTSFCNEPPSGAWNFQGPGFNLSAYLSLEFDIKWDNTKTLSIANFNSPPAGGEGGIVIWGTDLPGFSVRPTLGTVQIPAAAATGWAHVSLPINPAISGIDPSCGIVFKKWVTAAQVTAGGTWGFWVDNVILKGADGPPPPPTVSLAKATPGLAFVSASGGQYDRQNIVTVGDGYSWLGRPGPVSYSVDVAAHADNAHPGYELHFFFAPGAPDTSRSDPDWHEPSMLRWDIGNNADGSAYSALRYKTNAPDDNGIFYPPAVGTLGGPGSATMTGLWTLTFNNDTNITATSPSGTIFNTNLPPDVIALLTAGGTMKFYVGAVPGQPTRIGQMSVIKSIQVTGAAAPNLNSQFVGQPLNLSDWAVNAAANAQGVQEIPTNAKHWLQWTLPATGYYPQIAALVNGPWTDPNLGGFEGGGMRKSLILSTDLPNPNTDYFRLIKRPYTQLRVLLPGETAAPNTVTGKAGTPNPQTAGVPFSITVNSCDSLWRVVSATNVVNIASTDTAATLPANAALTAGTASFVVTLNTSPGSWTITASDVTDGAKTPNTSSAVTVP